MEKVLKSIRLSEDVIYIIQSYKDGENFTEKLENLVSKFYSTQEKDVISS